MIITVFKVFLFLMVTIFVNLYYNFNCIVKMNKYFLSLISILILFQAFHIFDEIFFKEKIQKDKGYIIIKVKEQKMSLKKRK